VWESKADGSFAISEDTWNEPLGRGTEIKLHLRDEAKEYLEEGKLKVSSYLHLFFIFTI
jgi:heat shock protein beta